MTPRSILLSLAVVVFFPSIGLSQQDAPARRWTWDGNVFFGHNRQVRRFIDLSAWESQNWPVVSPDVGRPSEAAGVVRAVRCDPVDRVAVLRGPCRHAAARGDARLGREPAVQRLQRQFGRLPGGGGHRDHVPVDALRRAEVAGKELFGLGPHEKQFAHRHWISTIGAFNVGDSHLLPRLPVGIGADITLYHIPSDLEFFYAPSRSFHVFIQWRPRTSAHAERVH